MALALPPPPPPSHNEQRVDEQLHTTRLQLKACMARIRNGGAKVDSRLFKLRTRLAQKAYSEEEIARLEKEASEVEA